MKGTGREIQRLQHNIVDLFHGIPASTDEAFTVDGRKHKHREHRKYKNNKIISPCRADQLGYL